MKKIILSLTCIFCFSLVFSQEENQIIELTNPSFEGVAAAGRSPLGWYNCGELPESPPDIHSRESNLFGVDLAPYDGETYLGMVTRDNDTWESISQRLSRTLIKNEMYSFSLFLAKSPVLESIVRRSAEEMEEMISNRDFKEQKKDFSNSIVLRIWGGNGYCDKIQLLHETSIVKHSEWKEYKITLQPKENFSHISFEAYYDVDYGGAYCGNLLMDNCSPIMKIDDDKKRLVEFDYAFKQNYLKQYLEATSNQNVSELITELKALDLIEVSSTLGKVVEIHQKIKNEEILNSEDQKYYNKAEKLLSKEMEKEGYQYILEEYLEY